MSLETTFIQLLISLLNKINYHMSTSYEQDFGSTMAAQENFE